MDFFIFSSFFHFFLLFSFFPEEAPEEAPNEHSQSTMDEDGEDDSSASRGEGGADAPAATPARPASASAITAIVLALGDAARAGQQRGDQARGRLIRRVEASQKLPRNFPDASGSFPDLPEASQKILEADGVAS